ncbi:N-acetylmuramoyl-L-alanine amidase [Fulvivirgaceae bacterium BMA10]|uniref:N-acetylmuramoyl-L-alanine amidase n=1 Tax=Splendidivirga corallicola TaxID=3051826 RepID=A0ABT8KT60_9BACT|nr:N-acetylmuramoyl-L-alanine amidase [Fulvivirgaceae bacterium BMA10]
MRATSIPKHEKTFFKNKIDSHGKKFNLADKTIPIKGTSEVMHYISCRRENNDNSFYYESKFKKTQIVIHFTAGYLKGDIATLTTPSNHVSVPFIIARNGAILNMWSSAYWSYHLGPGAIGGNTAGSKRTIAIEISNIGFLNKVGDNLVSAYSNTDVYCNLDENNFFTKLETPYREHQYFATFTNNQYKSLITLLRYLCAQYNIPRAFLAEKERYLTGSADEIPNFKGIVSHVNYRSSGKWDIGPAFDWDRLINGVDS